MANPINVIATHPRPHFDEIVAIWLLRKFGEERFPGIKDAEIQYWNRQQVTETPETYEARGVVLLGIGGGKFDEHPANGNARKENECCATLVASFLGTDDDPTLERIFRFAINNDLKASGHPFDLASIAKTLYNYESPEKVLEWTFIGLEAKHREQLQFFTVTQEEFERLAQIEKIGYQGTRIKIVSIVSDDEQMGKFARSRYGANAAVVVQKRYSGNVQIFSKKAFDIRLDEVVKILRVEEQRIKGQFITRDWEELIREGNVDGAEEWYFHEESQALLNGSITAPNIPATRIPFEDIREYVKIGIQNSRLHSKCDSRNCGSCYWQPWGLQRCRRLRFQTLHNK